MKKLSGTKVGFLPLVFCVSGGFVSVLFFFFFFLPFSFFLFFFLSFFFLQSSDPIFLPHNVSSYS